MALPRAGRSRSLPPQNVPCSQARSVAGLGSQGPWPLLDHEHQRGRKARTATGAAQGLRDRRPSSPTTHPSRRGGRIVVVVVGAGKAEAVKEVFRGPQDPIDRPVQFLQELVSNTVWLLDEDASGLL